MRQRIFRIAAISLAGLVAVMAVVAAAFMWRLSQGPVSLNFFRDRIEAGFNGHLRGMTADIDGVVLERDPETRIPTIRLTNVVLRDGRRNVIARAPRAAVEVDFGALLTGTIVPRNLDLIGPRIQIKRSYDGSLDLGFGDQAAPESEEVAVDDLNAANGTAPATEPAAETPASSLIDILAGTGETGPGIASLDEIEISRASVELYDEINDAIWSAPRADLTFRRMPYGFAVMANAEIASRSSPWRTELSISYRTQTKTYSVSARIDDLVPANISDKIFAISQLARVKIPLSGHAELELDSNGLLTRGSAEFSAAAGEVGFPDYLASPIIVDEGSLRVDYRPDKGGFEISDSSLLVGGSRARLNGLIAPIRSRDGRIVAVAIDLGAREVKLDPEGTVVDPIAIDRIDFKGTAAIETASLEIEDLVIMSGDTGVRLRGTLTGGEETAGILLSGRVRDVSSRLLKRIWPPIVAPKTRAWVEKNIRTGRISEGEFRVNIAPGALAQALRDRYLADEAVSLRFALADVTTSYFKSLPPLVSASGVLDVSGNTIGISIDRAAIELPSGGAMSLSGGYFKAKDLLAEITPASVGFALDAPAPAFIEFIRLPDLDLLRQSSIDVTRITGTAHANAVLEFPLVKNVRRDQVRTSVKARIESAGLDGVLPGIDVADGTLALEVGNEGVTLSGPVKINGMPAKIGWKRGAGEGAEQSVSVDAELDDKARAKMGASLGGLIKGPIGVKVRFSGIPDASQPIDIEADLSRAALQFETAKWYRPPVKGTRATLTYVRGAKGGGEIRNLLVKGDDLLIKGSAKLSPEGGIDSVSIGQLRFSDENELSLDAASGDEGFNVTLRASRLDGRQLLRSIFKPAPDGAGEAGGGPPIFVDLSVDRFYANRGEVVTGLTGSLAARGGKLARAELQGTFLSGQPIVLRVTPAAQGREVRLASRDGGAALRAANLYSKVAGGQLDLYAFMPNEQAGGIRQGQFTLRNFEVRNEAALAQLDQKGKPRKSGPRTGGIGFTKLTIPFTTDTRFIRIGDSLIRGPDLGAAAEGLIRKSDGAIDITGTIIPAYGLNSAISEIPLVGDILTGGKGQGVFGLTFALGGSVAEPQFQVNPVSAIAPGILRKFFEYGSGGDAPPPVSDIGGKNG